MNGFLNILKPPGMTSAAVVGYVRRMTGEKRVGHAGTLDPEAAGVLPIMIGRAARLFDYLVDKEKRMWRSARSARLPTHRMRRAKSSRQGRITLIFRRAGSGEAPCRRH